MSFTNYRLHCWMLLLLFVLILTSCGSASNQAEQATPVANKQISPLLEDSIADEAERKRTVIWDMPSGAVSAPAQWNPLARNARRDKGLHQSMIEPLFILNYESGFIEPWLGKQMTANDTLDVWTLTLREGVTWSDGEAFTADDVVFTVNLLLDNPDLELDFFAGFTSWVERVEKRDNLTVTFYLTGPNPRFQMDFFAVKVWGSFDIFPEHIWRDKDPYTFTNYDAEKGWPVFTGPYRLEDFTDNTFVYVRDDNWWGARTGFKPLPAPERMVWTYLLPLDADKHPLIKHLDTMGNVDKDTYEKIAELKPNLISWLDGLPFAWMDPCSRTFSFNTMQPPWDSKEMRWAINYAIDREEIVSDAYYDTTIPARHFFPPYPPLERYVQMLEDEGLYTRYPLMTNDMGKAQQLIEQQGWSMGSDGYYYKGEQQLALTIHAHEASFEMRRTAELIADRLQTIGVNASMQALSEAEWVERKIQGTFQAMIDWDSCGSVTEPWASLDRYHARWVQPLGEPVSNYNNQVRWANAQYSEIVDEMAPLPLGDPQIDTLFLDAMEIWLDELPFIPLAQNKELISFDTTYWQGWPTANNAYIHPPSWWQSTHIIIHSLEPTAQSGTVEDGP